ncbi:MAG: ATPase V [Treponema sp.]|nr:ATPase V [Treponema sp.]
MNYFFIGDPELVTAFRFVGIDGAVALNADDARSAFFRVTRGWDTTAGTALPGTMPESCRVLIVTEEAAGWLGEDLAQWQLSGRYPLVVEIPGPMGRLEGRKTLVDSIREAIGVHV